MDVHIPMMFTMQLFTRLCLRLQAGTLRRNNWIFAAAEKAGNFSSSAETTGFAAATETAQPPNNCGHLITIIIIRRRRIKRISRAPIYHIILSLGDKLGLCKYKCLSAATLQLWQRQSMIAEAFFLLLFFFFFFLLRERERC